MNKNIENINKRKIFFVNENIYLNENVFQIVLKNKFKQILNELKRQK